MLAARRRRGSIAVEFSLTLPILITTALSVGEVGFHLSERQRFVQATFEAARFASSGPDAPTDQQVRAHTVFVLDEMGLDPDGLQQIINRGYDGAEPVVTVTMSLPTTVLWGTVTIPDAHSQQFTFVQRS